MKKLFYTELLKKLKTLFKLKTLKSVEEKLLKESDANFDKIDLILGELLNVNW